MENRLTLAEQLLDYQNGIKFVKLHKGVIAILGDCDGAIAFSLMAKKFARLPSSIQFLAIMENWDAFRISKEINP